MKVSEPMSLKLRNTLRSQIVQDREQLRLALERKLQALTELNRAVALTEKSWFTCHIYDPWDNAEPDYRRGSGSATAKGLRNAVETSEKEYMARSGSSRVRDDGVLEYRVSIHLGDDTLNVPEEFWHMYTATGKKTQVGS